MEGGQRKDRRGSSRAEARDWREAIQALLLELDTIGQALVQDGVMPVFSAKGPVDGFDVLARMARKLATESAPSVRNSQAIRRAILEAEPERVATRHELIASYEATSLVELARAERVALAQIDLRPALMANTPDEPAPLRSAVEGFGYRCELEPFEWRDRFLETLERFLERPSFGLQVVSEARANSYAGIMISFVRDPAAPWCAIALDVVDALDDAWAEDDALPPGQIRICRRGPDPAKVNELRA